MSKHPAAAIRDYIDIIGANDPPASSNFRYPNTALPGHRTELDEDSAAIDAVIADPKFRSWFDGSQVTDATGSPLLCYHGTPQHVEVSEFRPFSHFGTIGAAQDRLMKKNHHRFPIGSRVFPVFLRITNPIELPDLDTHMTTDRIAITGLRRLMADTKAMMRLPKWRLPGEAVKVFTQHGVDGFRYRNVIEDKGSVSWIILSKEQVWPLFGGGDMDRIRAEKARKEAEYFAWLRHNWR